MKCLLKRLVWEASADEGDAPPVEYVVEQRDASARRGAALRLGTTPATEYNVEGLALGKSYVFVVSACNSIGRSEPSETPAVLARYAFGECRVRRNALKCCSLHYCSTV